MSDKFYVAQWGFEIFGEGSTEQNAVKSARENGLNFEDCDLNHIATRGGNAQGFEQIGSHKLVTRTGSELSQGMIVVMTEEEKNLYW